LLRVSIVPVEINAGNGERKYCFIVTGCTSFIHRHVPLAVILKKMQKKCAGKAG